MSKGKVKYFNEAKGWGIIADEGRDQDVYVHHTAIDMPGYKTLHEGQEVVYDITLTDSGPKASHVRLS